MKCKSSKYVLPSNRTLDILKIGVGTHNWMYVRKKNFHVSCTWYKSLVSGLSKLQWFNVSNNKLQWFDYAFVPMSLEWLDIQYNEIEELGNYYKLKSGFNLKRLDASGNLIQSLNKLSLPMSLEIIGKSWRFNKE